MSARESKRTLLQKFDVGDGTYETLFELAEFPPNEVVQRHSHPGIEAGYVLEGECIFEFDGQPTRVAFKAGESYQLPACSAPRRTQVQAWRETRGSSINRFS
jgi:quercetin dioxygenase-like cupin family protein